MCNENRVIVAWVDRGFEDEIVGAGVIDCQLVLFCIFVLLSNQKYEKSQRGTL